MTETLTTITFTWKPARMNRDSNKKFQRFIRDITKEVPGISTKVQLTKPGLFRRDIYDVSIKNVPFLSVHSIVQQLLYGVVNIGFDDLSEIDYDFRDIEVDYKESYILQESFEKYLRVTEKVQKQTQSIIDSLESMKETSRRIIEGLESM